MPKSGDINLDIPQMAHGIYVAIWTMLKVFKMPVQSISPQFRFLSALLTILNVYISYMYVS